MRHPLSWTAALLAAGLSGCEQETECEEGYERDPADDECYPLGLRPYLDPVPDTTEDDDDETVERDDTGKGSETGVDPFDGAEVSGTFSVGTPAYWKTYNSTELISTWEIFGTTVPCEGCLYAFEATFLPVEGDGGEFSGQIDILDQGYGGGVGYEIGVAWFSSATPLGVAIVTADYTYVYNRNFSPYSIEYGYYYGYYAYVGTWWHDF